MDGEGRADEGKKSAGNVGSGERFKQIVGKNPIDHSPMGPVIGRMASWSCVAADGQSDVAVDDINDDEKRYKVHDYLKVGHHHITMKTAAC